MFQYTHDKYKKISAKGRQENEKVSGYGFILHKLFGSNYYHKKKHEDNFKSDMIPRIISLYCIAW